MSEANVYLHHRKDFYCVKTLNLVRFKGISTLD